MTIYNITVRASILTAGQEQYGVRSLYFGNCPRMARKAFLESKQLDHPASPEGPGRETKIETTIG